MLKDAVEAALADIVVGYGPEHVRAVPDGQGGAWVEITDIDLGAVYTPATTFAIALLPFNLPNADIYPLFIRPDLERADKAPLGEGFSATVLDWPGDREPRPVMQVSRRTRRNDFARQRPVQKIEKVLEWVREH